MKDTMIKLILSIIVAAVAAYRITFLVKKYRAGALDQTMFWGNTAIFVLLLLLAIYWFFKALNGIP
jgi:ABC-type nickel/cobalt efflux system permease component RcnA